MARTYAPSRLHKPTTNGLKQPALLSQRATTSNQRTNWRVPTGLQGQLRAYVRYSICLFIALFGYYGTYQLMQRVYPSQMQHILWTNSYLPFTTLIFLSNFFLFTFLSLSKRWGLWLSLVINCILYWRLNQVAFDLAAVVIIATIALLLFFLIFQDTHAIIVKQNGKK